MYMIGELAKKAYNSLYHLPPNAVDLKEFAEQILNQFINELVKNEQGIAWNSGFDGVIFVHKSVDGHKSLMQIKEEFLGQQSNPSNSDVPQGTGTPRVGERSSEIVGRDKLSEY